MIKYIYDATLFMYCHRFLRVRAAMSPNLFVQADIIVLAVLTGLFVLNAILLFDLKLNT